MLIPYVLFVLLYVGSYLLIKEFESWITGVCSPYVVSLHTMSSGKSLQMADITNPDLLACFSDLDSSRHHSLL